MATLEDAAEELVVRLKGLDSEIEESEHALQDLRGKVDETSAEVEEEWSHLTDAIASFVSQLREEQEQLAAELRDALQATAEANATVHEDGSRGRASIGDGQSELDALAQHATGLEPGVESLMAEAGETPAHALASRAKEVEEELARILEEARDFIRDDVVSALEQVAGDIRERCHAVESTIAEQRTVALQAIFDAWEPQVDALEAHVAEQGFVASRSHARAVVDWTLEECKTACATHLDAARQVIEETTAPLQELAAAAQLTADSLLGKGGELLAELGSTRDSVGRAVSALSAVQQLLGSYTFVGSEP